ncbi:hypothetical protein P692DRAFT_201794948 [Suillus brevipes Sb2]|nr:hypothetical protein P692DRAFT_201794948 [Suillus brevipes Sb2]
MSLGHKTSSLSMAPPLRGRSCQAPQPDAMKNHFPALCRTLISGASGGIGTETAKLCLSLGENVTAHYNSNSEPKQTLKFSFPALQCAQTDLFSESAMKSMYIHFREHRSALWQ